MTSTDMQAQQVLRFEEQIRQERISFDQSVKNAEKWFYLQLAMGVLTVVLLPTFMIITSYIIFHGSNFSESVVTMAASALLVDVLGTLLAAWKLVLADSIRNKASPVISGAQAGGV